MERSILRTMTMRTGTFESTDRYGPLISGQKHIFRFEALGWCVFQIHIGCLPKIFRSATLVQILGIREPIRGVGALAQGINW